VISLNERSATWEGYVVRTTRYSKVLTIPAAIADKFPVGAKVKVTIELVGEE